MKITDIIGEGVLGDIAFGVKKSLTPKVFKDIAANSRGDSMSDYEHCIRAAAQYGFSPDECNGMRGAPAHKPQQQPQTTQTQPAQNKPSQPVPQQVEIGGTTLTRMPGGDWYEMTTNTLVTDPSIIARADKKWQIVQQNIQMTQPPQPAPSTINNFRRTPSRRGRR